MTWRFGVVYRIPQVVPAITLKTPADGHVACPALHPRGVPTGSAGTPTVWRVDTCEAMSHLFQVSTAEEKRVNLIVSAGDTQMSTAIKERANLAVRRGNASRPVLVRR